MLKDFVQNIGTDTAAEDIVVAKLQAADNSMESIVKATEEVIKPEDEKTLIVLEEEEEVAQNSVVFTGLSRTIPRDLRNSCDHNPTR